jgi:hypothetical protein
MNVEQTRLIGAFSLLFCANSMQAAFLDSDIPGDGTIFCGDPVGISCPATFSGVVVSTPAGLLSGTLQAGGSTLDLALLGTSPVSLNFSVSEPNDLGPLGLNSRFNPQAAHVALADDQTRDATRDVTIPLSGQLLTLNVTNRTASTLTSLQFQLNEPGLSFGIYCTGLIDTGRNQDPADDSQACSPFNPVTLGLLETPTGPGTLDSSGTDPNSPNFGNVLLFTNLGLGTDDTGTFTFFLTDYKRTRNNNTNGTPASEAFALEITPGFNGIGPAPVPEPMSFVLSAIGLCALAGVRVFSKARSRPNRLS